MYCHNFFSSLVNGYYVLFDLRRKFRANSCQNFKILAKILTLATRTFILFSMQKRVTQN